MSTIPRRVAGDTGKALRTAWEVTFACPLLLGMSLALPLDWHVAQQTGRRDACTRCYEAGDPFPWWILVVVLLMLWFSTLATSRAWRRYLALRAEDRRVTARNLARRPDPARRGDRR